MLTCLTLSNSTYVIAEERLIDNTTITSQFFSKKTLDLTTIRGKHLASYNYSLHKLPSRERSYSQRIDGHATILLKSPDEVDACFAVYNEESSSRSKYISADKKHHLDKYEQRFLLGASGKWSVKGNILTIELTQSWKNSCVKNEDSLNEQFKLNLKCINISISSQITDHILACHINPEHYFLKKLLMSIDHSGNLTPFSFKKLPGISKPVTSDEQWLLLGKPPGLIIQSQEGRRSNKAEVQFIHTPVSLSEKKFIQKR